MCVTCTLCRKWAGGAAGALPSWSRGRACGHRTLARGACPPLLPAGAGLFLGTSPVQATVQHGHHAPASPVTVLSQPCCRLALYLASGAWAEPGGISIAMRRRRPHTPEGDRAGFSGCLGFVIASSLDKQELTEHDPILKTITLIIGQTLPVI